MPYRTWRSWAQIYCRRTGRTTTPTEVPPCPSVINRDHITSPEQLAAELRYIGPAFPKNLRRSKCFISAFTAPIREGYYLYYTHGTNKLTTSLFYLFFFYREIVLVFVFSSSPVQAFYVQVLYADKRRSWLPLPASPSPHRLIFEATFVSIFFSHYRTSDAPRYRSRCAYGSAKYPDWGKKKVAARVKVKMIPSTSCINICMHQPFLQQQPRPFLPSR